MVQSVTQIRCSETIVHGKRQEVSLCDKKGQEIWKGSVDVQQLLKVIGSCKPRDRMIVIPGHRTQIYLPNNRKEILLIPAQVASAGGLAASQVQAHAVPLFTGNSNKSKRKKIQAATAQLNQKIAVLSKPTWFSSHKKQMVGLTLLGLGIGGGYLCSAHYGRITSWLNSLTGRLAS